MLLNILHAGYTLLNYSMISGRSYMRAAGKKKNLGDFFRKVPYIKI
jgi:hypothetical protein